MTSRKLMAIACGAIVIGSMIFPAEALAQRRRVVVRRAPVRTSVFVGVGFSPFYYPYRPFYSPWYAYGYPYGWFPPYGYGYPYPYYGGGGYSSLRIQVEPKETEVYIDGYWAGTVDDFDGFFQRMHLEPGEHEVTLYLEGHRTARQKVYLQPDATFRIKHTMVPLGPGDAPEARPVPPPESQRQGYDRYGRPERSERPERPEHERPEPPERTSFGSLAIRVQPGEAQVLVDGEEWEGPGSGRLVIELPEGEHRIEARREGYSTYTSTVRIRRGETTTLNVSLARE